MPFANLLIPMILRQLQMLQFAAFSESRGLPTTKVISSVTRFGEISPCWQKIKNIFANT